ncbi:hypothetical protein GCM10025858_24380 [Alicyclobacillus sacchari]|nr:hypothetical protein GCM10025858_24380 [Alicyclobacillus sacchari]
MTEVATDLLFPFVFFYPFVMSVVWMMGATLFFWRRERHATDTLPTLRMTPMVSILVPCYNEAAMLEETLSALRVIDYPNYEVLVLNDASTDHTVDVAYAAMASDKRIRMVNIPVRCGKAHALNAASLRPVEKSWSPSMPTLLSTPMLCATWWLISSMRAASASGLSLEARACAIEQRCWARSKSWNTVVS